jgi:hypothetical protein
MRPYEEALVVFRKMDSDLPTLSLCQQLATPQLNGESTLLTATLPLMELLMSEEFKTFRVYMESQNLTTQLIWLRGSFIAASYINFIETFLPSHQRFLDAKATVIAYATNS